MPLTRQNATGNGVPSTDDLIHAQTAILSSNNTVLGAINQLRQDMGGRLERIDKKVEGVCSDVAEIKTQRAIEAARAQTAKELAADHAVESREHELSFRWRIGIAVAAGGSLGGLILGFARFFA